MANEFRPFSHDQGHRELFLGSDEYDLLGREPLPAALRRSDVRLTEDRGHRHASGAHPDVHCLWAQGREEIR